MSKKNNKSEMKQGNNFDSKAPNSLVPNRAHTEMKKQGCSDDKCEIKYENKSGKSCKNS